MFRSVVKTIGLPCLLALQVPLVGCDFRDLGEWLDPGGPPPTEWPIATSVLTTAQQQVLPIALPADTPHINPADVPLYEVFGYSAWQTGAGLPYVKRTDLAPGYSGAPNAARLLSFFCMSDVHLTDKESPAQPIYVGWSAPYGLNSTGLSAAYSPTMVSTTQVLDAAVQTINALHQQSAFDFGIALGDDINNAQYNELRWFIDTMDGAIITPSSGAHAGADTIDYQRPFQAAGLDPAIPWYQVIGNHDQFWMGSAYETAKTEQAHIGSAVINMAGNPTERNAEGSGYYMGVVDGSTEYGDIVGAGPEEWFPTPPTVIADPDRRPLATPTSSTLNWMREFFNTSSKPVGHGFTQDNLDRDSTCYSFQPNSNLPLKVIVLDDTLKGPDQPNYARACLDQPRLDWLLGELQDGQNSNQLMIIAAHVPVYPQQTFDPNSGNYSLFASPSVVDDLSLLSLLHGFPNLILWISGHRHVNIVTPQPSSDPDHPEQSFWEVETSSLRDFPQEFRTFDIHRNSDNTISIIVTNVDPAVVGGSPAAKSRGYAIAAARIFGANDNADPPTGANTSSQAYNAELVKQLTPEMQAVIANCGTPTGEQ